MIELERWKNEIRVSLAVLGSTFEERFGFAWEPAENFVRDADTGPANGLPAELAEFYRHVGEVCLADVHVGCFILPAAIVASAADGELPRHLTGTVNAPVCSFGADGGGNLFVLDETSGAVYFVPLSEIRDHAWIEVGDAPRRVADSLQGFLIRIRSLVHEFATIGSTAGLA